MKVSVINPSIHNRVYFRSVYTVCYYSWKLATFGTISPQIKRFSLEQKHLTLNLVAFAFLQISKNRNYVMIKKVFLKSK